MRRCSGSETIGAPLPGQNRSCSASDACQIGKSQRLMPVERLGMSSPAGLLAIVFDVLRAMGRVDWHVHDRPWRPGAS